MYDFNAIPKAGTYESEKRKFLSRTYTWMGLALLVSAASAFFTASNYTLMRFLFGSGAMGFIVLAIAEIALVWWLSSSIRSISVSAATIGFLVYSVLNGATFSSIFFIYRLSSIGYCFIATSATFFIMSIYGARTKRNLDSAARYLMMGLFGIIIASVVNMVVSMITKQPLTMFDWLISFAVVIVFTGLTAYDTQRVLRTANYATSSDDYKKVAIIAALELYLDFINIFLALLRLFGRRR